MVTEANIINYVFEFRSQFGSFVRSEANVQYEIFMHIKWISWTPNASVISAYAGDITANRGVAL